MPSKIHMKSPLLITALGALLIAPPGSSPLAAYQDRGSSLRAQQDQSSYFEEPGRYDDRGEVQDDRGLDRNSQDRNSNEDQTGDLPDPGTAARIRYLRGTLTIERASEQGTEQATLNTPVFEGDKVSSEPGALAEFQLADGSMVRVDQNSSLEFRTLVDPYGKIETSSILALSSGSLYVDVPAGAKQREILLQVDTPSASAYVDRPGLYRIDVADDSTRVSAVSSQGEVEVVGDRGSVFLKGAERTEVLEGEAPDRPFSFNFNARSMDDFDRWNQQRIAQLARYRGQGRYGGGQGQYGEGQGRYGEEESRPGAGVDYERIPDEVAPYAGELSGYGRWVSVPDYGYCWYPYGVGADWRPYYYGRWVYGPYGYYWSSHEPWGWAPYHYGRWSFAASIGWVWVPGHVFSGSWVSWYYGPTYVGWCPLDFYDRPAFIHIGFSIGGFGCDPRVWSFVPYNQIVVNNVTRVVVKNVNVTQINQGVIVRQAVPIAPHAIVRDPAARTRVLDLARHRAEIERAALRTSAPGKLPLKGVVKPGQSFREEDRRALAMIQRREVQRRPIEALHQAQSRAAERSHQGPASSPEARRRALEPGQPGRGTATNPAERGRPAERARPEAGTPAERGRPVERARPEAGTPAERTRPAERARPARPEAGTPAERGAPRTHERPQATEGAPQAGPRGGNAPQQRERAVPPERKPQERERAVAPPPERKKNEAPPRAPRTHPRTKDSGREAASQPARSDGRQAALADRRDPREHRRMDDERLRRLFRDADRPRSSTAREERQGRQRESRLLEQPRREAAPPGAFGSERAPTPRELRAERAPAPREFRPERAQAPREFRPERSPAPREFRPERPQAPRMMPPAQPPALHGFRPERAPSPPAVMQGRGAAPRAPRVEAPGGGGNHPREARRKG